MASLAAPPALQQHLPRRAHRALLSAHRGAAAQHGLVDNSHEALERAAGSDVEFVEFDVNLTADGALVLHHDTRVRTEAGVRPIHDLTVDDLTACLGRRPTTYDEALACLARAGKAAHVDLKLTSPAPCYADARRTVEAQVADQALRRLGCPTQFVVTTTVEESVVAVRRWSEHRGVAPLVGLSIGGVVQPARPRRLDVRLVDPVPTVRFDRCGATLVVVNRRLADVSVLRWAARRGLPTLVWTVDDTRSLRRYLADPRVWMVTSNHPARAA